MTLQIHGRPVELTERETETLRHIAAGEQNREMAYAMRLSPKTVEKYRQGVMRKLDLHDRVLLARYAISRGLVPNLFNREPTQ